MKYLTRPFLKLVFALFLILPFTNAHAQKWLWAKGAVGATAVEGWDVATDSNSNAYICGFFYGDSIKFDNFTLKGNNPKNNSFPNIYFVKYDSIGKVLIAKTAVVETSDGYGSNAYNIATDRSNHIYLAGTYDSKEVDFGNNCTLKQDTPLNCLYIVQYSSNGNAVWARQTKGFAFSNKIITDNIGNLYVVGKYYLKAVFGKFTLTVADTSNNREDHGFLAKYDSTGTVIWAKDLGSAFGSTGFMGYGIANDTFNNIYLTGSYYDSIRFGTYFFKDPNKTNLFITEYDTNGNVVWSRTSDGYPIDIEGRCISTDKTGNIYVTGIYYDTLRMNQFVEPKEFDTTAIYPSPYVFILKCSPTGNPIWIKNIKQGLPYSISTDKFGNSYISNSVGLDSTNQIPNKLLIDSDTMAVPPGIDPMFVVEYDFFGNFICASVLGSGGDDVNTIVVDDKGNAYLTGDYAGHNFKIGSFTLSTTADEEAFVAKLTCSTTNEVNSLYSPPSSLNLFPNPASNTLYITTNETEGTATITNLIGQTVYESKFTSTYFEVQVSTFSSGIYLVQLRTKNGFEVKKFVKE